MIDSKDALGQSETEPPDHHTIYLTPLQVRAVAALPMMDGESPVTITQADVTYGGEHRRHLALCVPGELDIVHLDLEGKTCGDACDLATQEAV